MIKFTINIIYVGLLSLILSGNCFSQQKNGSKNQDVQIFGITLGKSLNELEVNECKIKRDDIVKIYEDKQDEICWEDNSPKAILGIKSEDFKKIDFIRLGSSPSMDVFVCDACIGLQVLYAKNALITELVSEPIAEIQMGFPFEMADSFINLVTKKFGKPNRIEKSILKNKLGASFDNKTYYWTFGSAKLMLTKRFNGVESGLFTATHYDKWSRDSKALSKQLKDAESKF